MKQITPWANLGKRHWSVSQNVDNFTPRLGLVYQPIPELAIFGSLLGVFGISMSILGTLAAGILIDKLGRKGTLLVASEIALLGGLFYQLPTFEFTQLPILYSIVSVAFFSLGMVGTTAFTIMMDKSRPEMAGTNYTLQTSLIGIGSVLSAAVSGVLAEAVGYRGVFALSGVLGMVCLAVIAKKLTLSTHSVSRDKQINSHLEKSM